MKTNCDYCGAVINDYDEKCPNCGAVNAHYRKVANEQPKTIDELKAWYAEKNLPAEDVTRFYIGKDVKQAKAFGIYKDEEKGTFVVYKNKADGSRAVRYDGGDEAYAVNEIFQKLKEIMAQQKANNVSKRSSGSYRGKMNVKPKKKMDSSTKIALGVLGGAILIGGVLSSMEEADKKKYFEDHPAYNRYYSYHHDYYYNLDGEYYYYDADDAEWEYYGEAPFDEDQFERYSLDGDYDDYGLDDFEDTNYYDNWYDSFYSSDNNSGNNYDSNDNDNNWDSGWDSNDNWDSDFGGDWDSDW